MGKTDEQILEEIIALQMGLSKNGALLAMEQSKKQEAIEFAEWIPRNAVIAEDGYHYLWLKNLEPITSEQLYSLYLTTKQ